MSVAAYLSSLLSIEGNEMPLDPSFVEKFIRSVEDLQSFNEFVKSQPVLGRTICSAASWELFDTIYVLSLSDSHGDSFRVLCDAALLLTSEVRPKEMLLMISEKLAGCNETTTLQLLLLTMQQMLLKTADEMIWKQGNSDTSHLSNYNQFDFTFFCVQVFPLCFERWSS